MLQSMRQPFLNDDQGVEIYVSNSDAKHSMSFRNDDQIKIIGIIDRLIKNAVKTGEVEVMPDEANTTKTVHIYYVPVNIDGKQYSARMVVKEYYGGSHVLDELHLYNVQFKKEKTGETPVRPDGTRKVLSPVSAYKVKDLIHSTQENDLELLGVNKQEAKFSLSGSRNHYNNGGDVIDDDKVLARAMYEQRLRTSLYQITEYYLGLLFLLGSSVAAHELVHTSGGIDEFRLTGVERVARV